jgi:hypothetical protein
LLSEPWASELLKLNWSPVLQKGEWSGEGLSYSSKSREIPFIKMSNVTGCQHQTKQKFKRFKSHKIFLARLPTRFFGRPGVAQFTFDLSITCIALLKACVNYEGLNSAVPAVAVIIRGHERSSVKWLELCSGKRETTGGLVWPMK